MSIREQLDHRVEGATAPPRAVAPAPSSIATTSDDRCRLSCGALAILVAQLALLTVAIRQFQVESSAFLRVTLLAFAGFAVHSVLPLRYRLPFFVLLSFTAIGWILGLGSAAWLVAIGLLLVGICHLRMSLGARVGLLVFVAAALASLRVEWLPAPWPRAIWPILGSMFMFRLIVYLYDISHDKAPTSAWRTLAYFFLLPNVCFPLFPVVDYKTFRRNYYDRPAFETYQVGVDWMVRGVLHLVLYRFVYYYVTMAPADVTRPRDLVRYVVATFLLYLRVSGQFHIIVGILHLFGFNLPETHHRYFLASSFTDFWRRINIYWKDFMLKVFYYPIYFRLRRWGTTQALVLSTLLVFLATWLLHSYQWFWLRGSFPITWPDVAFWGVLALLVVANSLYELRHGRERALRPRAFSVRTRVRLALKTAGTFCVICLLWSLWTAESVSAWLSLCWGIGERPGAHAGALAVVLLGAIFAGADGPATGDGHRRWTLWRSVPIVQRSTAATIVSLLILALIGIPAVYSRFGVTAANLILSLRSGQLSRADAALMERGYYEELLRVDRFNSQLWEVYVKRPSDWLDVQGAGLDRFTGDFLQRELLPSSSSTTRYGKMTTNRWGMRDQEYDKRPAPNTYRAALLGASLAFGSGVNDGETFEAVLERRLNAEQADGRRGKYEILNFAVPGYSPLHQVMVLDKAFTFEPDVVYYVAAGHEASATLHYLAEVVRKKIDVPYRYLDEVIRRAGIGPDTLETTARRRLEPFRDEMMSWVYGEIVRRCRERGILPVWMFAPWPGMYKGEIEVISIAKQAGFVVLDITDAYTGHDLKTLWFSEWDTHPNALGHRLIAVKLYDRLQGREGVLAYRRAGAAARDAAGGAIQR